MFVSVGFIVDGQREEDRKIVEVEEGNPGDIFSNTRGGNANTLLKEKFLNTGFRSANLKDSRISAGYSHFI